MMCFLVMVAPHGHGFEVPPVSQPRRHQIRRLRWMLSNVNGEGEGPEGRKKESVRSPTDHSDVQETKRRTSYSEAGEQNWQLGGRA